MSNTAVAQTDRGLGAEHLTYVLGGVPTGQSRAVDQWPGGGMDEEMAEEIMEHAGRRQRTDGERCDTTGDADECK